MAVCLRATVQERAGKLVAEAAAQSVAVVEEASLTNSRNEAVIDKMKALVAQLQHHNNHLQAKLTHAQKERERLLGALGKARDEVKRCAANSRKLQSQVDLQKTVSMDLLRRYDGFCFVSTVSCTACSWGTLLTLTM